MSDMFLLAFGAHPDDVELGAGATCALHAYDGVAICDLTAAELSSNGDPVTRQAEAARAAEELGVAERLCLGLPDRGLSVTPEHIAAIVKVIRQYRPRVVLAPLAQDRHPDHSQCALLVREAVFSSGLHRYEDGLQPHRPAAFYHYMINGHERPTIAVDVSTVYERKMRALRSYASQFSPAHGVQTPLTSEAFLPMIEGRDRLFGQAVGCRYAEGLRRDDPAYVGSLRAVLPES